MPTSHKKGMCFVAEPESDQRLGQNGQMSRIRAYQPTDLAAVYDVCVRTGASGADATGNYHNDDLLPDIYAGPYATLEPGLAFVVDTAGGVAGYILAAADTRSFVERYRREWLPGFAAKYPHVQPPVTPEDTVIAVGYCPESMLVSGVDDYPAHLHIDLLPEVQGQGLGRALVRTLLSALRDRGVAGVHLGVSPQNLNARAFYARLGFHPLPADPANDSVVGILTDAPV
jgi:ribosomal protein S18 acetylase RimI-like enzyme